MVAAFADSRTPQHCRHLQASAALTLVSQVLRCRNTVIHHADQMLPIAIVCYPAQPARYRACGLTVMERDTRIERAGDVIQPRDFETDGEKFISHQHDFCFFIGVAPGQQQTERRSNFTVVVQAV